jgi:hypothetical protein
MLTCNARAGGRKVRNKPTSRLLSRTSAETNVGEGQSRADADKAQLEEGVEGWKEVEDIKILGCGWYLPSNDRGGGEDGVMRTLRGSS